MKRLFCFTVMFLLSSASHSDDRIRVFEMRESVFMHAWHLIVEESNLNPKYVNVTQAEARELFSKGDLMLTCCTVPEWRQRPKELEVQLFTKPFFYVVNHLVFHEDNVLTINDPKDLRKFNVVTVKGYTFEEAVKFGTIVYVDTLEDALQMVARGEADLTIANNQEFYAQQRKFKLPIIMGPTQAEYGLRARVHRERAELVELLNNTIDKIRKNGHLNIALAAGMRGADEQ